MLAREKLTERLNREPTTTEIAEETGESRADIVTAMESVSEPVSLYEPVYSEAGDTLYVVDQLKDSCDDKTWLDELAVKQTLASLAPREKKILYLRFFKGRTQMEVAKQIGISQAQVSRLEKSALDKVKAQF
jgi:RNA polymerase sporulation-specific sigma factor